MEIIINNKTCKVDTSKLTKKELDFLEPFKTVPLKNENFVLCDAWTVDFIKRKYGEEDEYLTSEIYLKKPTDNELLSKMCELGMIRSDYVEIHKIKMLDWKD